MSRHIQCPRCQKRLKAGEKLAGTVVRCPSCKTEFFLGSSGPPASIPFPSPTVAATQPFDYAWLWWIPGIVFALVIGYQKLTKSPSKPAAAPVVSAQQQAAVSQELSASGVEAVLDVNKQAIFDALHPIGKATAVKVHEMTNEQSQSGPILTIRFTLYWEGPVNKAGFTKVQQSGDLEAGRWFRPQIIATNGITLKETGAKLGDLFGLWLRYQAEKSATREYLQSQ